MTDSPERSHFEADGPFRLHEGTDWSRFRSILKDKRFTGEAVTDLSDLCSDFGRWNLPLALVRTEESTDFHILARLFLLAQDVPREQVRRVLSPEQCDQLVESGLLCEDDSGVRSQAMILPFEEFLVASDFTSDVTGRPTEADFVIGVARASLLLAQFTPRRTVRTTLDLGTGSGFHALHGSRHADRVVATDLCRRALNFAAFNARINGVENLELRAGSLYEPVADESFDLIVANPPFVMSPESTFTHRESGGVGDALSRQVLCEAVDRLNDGGCAAVALNWIHQNAEDWQQPVLDWLDGKDCDAWILRMQMFDPIGYASVWLQEERPIGGAAFASALTAWVDYLQQLGAGAISLGIVLLRRRTAGRRWRRAEVIGSDVRAGSCSGQVVRIFDNLDLLESLADDRQLLDIPLSLAPDHRLDYQLAAENGDWNLRSAHLRLTGGLGYTMQLERPATVLLAACDGTRPLSAAIHELAHRFEADVEQITPSVLTIARELLEKGFLEVVGGRR